jgi:hypothetical protein
MVVVSVRRFTWSDILNWAGGDDGKTLDTYVTN